MTQLIRSAKWFGLAGLVALAGCADPRLNLGPDDLINGGGSNGQHTSTQAVGGQGGAATSGSKGGQGGSVITSGTGTGGTTGSTSILSCDAANLPQKPWFNACAQPVGGWSDPPDDGVNSPTHDLNLSGTVKSVTKGNVNAGCLSAQDAVPGTEIIALTVAALTGDIMRDYNVEYQVPSNTVTWSVGDPIEVTYSRSGSVSEWGRTDTSLTLRRNQVVEVYVGLSGGYNGSISKFATEPFAFSEGAVLCHQVDGCGTVAHRNLLATNANGTVTVPLNRSVDVGQYRVTNGGLTQIVSSSNQCMDWGATYAHVAVLRNPPQATP